MNERILGTSGLEVTDPELIEIAVIVLGADGQHDARSRMKAPSAP